MILVLPEPAAGARLIVCDGCAPAARRFLYPVLPIDVVPGVVSPLIGGERHCQFCRWCGMELHVPDRCVLHGSSCPTDQPEQTIQAMAVVRQVRALFCSLTRDGWDHLAEEIRACGRQGHPTLHAVVEGLVGDPTFVHDHA